MQKQKILTIEDNTYIIDAFKGKDGWKYLPKVLKIVLPIFKTLSEVDESAEGFDNPEEVLDKISQEKFFEDIQNLLEKEDSDEVYNLVIDLLSKVSKNGEVLNFDEEFSQNYLTMFKLVFEVVKLNYLKSFQKLATKETS